MHSLRKRLRCLVVPALLVHLLVSAQGRVVHFEPPPKPEILTKVKEAKPVEKSDPVDEKQAVTPAPHPKKWKQIALHENLQERLIDLQDHYKGNDLVLKGQTEADQPIKIYFDTKEISFGDNVIIHADKNWEKYKMEDIVKFQNRSFAKEEIHLVQILDEIADKRDFNKMKTAAKQNSIDYALLDRNRMEKIFEKAKGQVVLLTSHFENGQLFARTSDNSPIPEKTFSADELKGLAKKYNVNLFFLGCETERIQAGTGLVKPTTNRKINEHLSVMMNELGQRKEISRGDLLTKLLPEDNQFVVVVDDLLTDNNPVIVEMTPAEHPQMPKASTGDGQAGNGEANRITVGDTDITIPVWIAFVGGIGFIGYKTYKQKRQS